MTMCYTTFHSLIDAWDLYFQEIHFTSKELFCDFLIRLENNTKIKWADGDKLTDCTDVWEKDTFVISLEILKSINQICVSNCIHESDKSYSRFDEYFREYMGTGVVYNPNDFNGNFI